MKSSVFVTEVLLINKKIFRNQVYADVIKSSVFVIEVLINKKIALNRINLRAFSSEKLLIHHNLSEILFKEI